MPMTGDGHFSTAIMTRLGALLEAGGVVMWPLLVVGLLAWTLIALRVMGLREVKRAHRRWIESKSRVNENKGIEFDPRLQKLELRRHAVVIDTLIAAAPLLGLLGTVSGMIATFEGLTSMTLFSENGGIAGGISVALTTTQAGLMIAIPAYFANKVLGRKVRKVEQKLDTVMLDLMADGAATGGPEQ